MGEEYKEIRKLAGMLATAGIPFLFREVKDGYQVLCCKESVIEHEGSYGSKFDRLEIRGSCVADAITAIEAYRMLLKVFEKISKKSGEYHYTKLDDIMGSAVAR